MCSRPMNIYTFNKNCFHFYIDQTKQSKKININLLKTVSSVFFMDFHLMNKIEKKGNSRNMKCTEYIFWWISTIGSLCELTRIQCHTQFQSVECNVCLNGIFIIFDCIQIQTINKIRAAIEKFMFFPSLLCEENMLIDLSIVFAV